MKKKNNKIKQNIISVKSLLLNQTQPITNQRSNVLKITAPEDASNVLWGNVPEKEETKIKDTAISQKKDKKAETTITQKSKMGKKKRPLSEIKEDNESTSNTNGPSRKKPRTCQLTNFELTGLSDKVSRENFTKVLQKIIDKLNLTCQLISIDIVKKLGVGRVGIVCVQSDSNDLNTIAGVEKLKQNLDGKKLFGETLKVTQV
ncbi:hypothetical protein RFI_04289 [Reticulomyxa filosa]|uniref:Uncharacterized protein n=1 Tax=Reticulomyxa filosa TaxID=46433 RepID=X6P5E9_RETFI|nr:hypothetical protein RFI_04289 [Reticulomyxa filosa]|eukprot:ETO32827.1 hypothetical protein RFI_04289 [Reticulomyxa filosa]